jgi:hypothetical protein
MEVYNMSGYAGPFNLNIWLRIFIRADLVDTYETRCAAIVNKHAGAGTSSDVIEVMFQELNAELMHLLTLIDECRNQEE